MGKVYTIKSNRENRFVINQLLSELKFWDVSPKKYTIGDNQITTSSKDVVDVATETFIKMPSLITITVEKKAKSQ